MFLLQLMHFQQRRLTAFYTCVYLVYQSCTAQFARFFALDSDAFYEVIIMQMFSAWRLDILRPLRLAQPFLMKARREMIMPTFTISTDLATLPTCPPILWASFFKSRSVNLTSLVQQEKLASLKLLAGKCFKEAPRWWPDLANREDIGSWFFSFLVPQASIALILKVLLLFLMSYGRRCEERWMNKQAKTGKNWSGKSVSLSFTRSFVTSLVVNTFDKGAIKEQSRDNFKAPFNKKQARSEIIKQQGNVIFCYPTKDHQIRRGRWWRSRKHWNKNPLKDS